MTSSRLTRGHLRPRPSATRPGRWLCWLTVQLGATVIVVPLALLDWWLLAHLLHSNHLAIVVLSVVVGAGTAATTIPGRFPAVAARLAGHPGTQWLLVCWRAHRQLARALARHRAGRVLLRVTSTPRVRRAHPDRPASAGTRIGTPS
jgi:hypothetical protein